MRSKSMKFIFAVTAALLLFVGVFSMSSCSYCAHDLEVNEKVASTCIEHGHSYSYKCKKCGKLFAYSTSKGLYEIDKAIELPLADHTVSDNIGARLKEGISAPASLFDYEITTKCALCEEEFVLSHENLIPFSPTAQTLKDNGNNISYLGKRTLDEAANRYITTVKLYKAIKSSSVTSINYVNDPDWVGKQGASQRMPLYIPFSNDSTRHLLMFIHNKSAVTTLKFGWTIDEKSWSNVTVAPGEYTWFLIDGERGETNAAGMAMRYSNADGSETLGETMEVELSGFYYTSGKVENISVDAQPVKTTYTAGETFDPTGVKLFASYNESFVTKTLISTEYTYDLQGVPLKEGDTKVVFSYGGKSVSVPITVTGGV